MPRYLTILSLLTIGAPAFAGDTPLLKPGKDVVIDYRTTGTARGPMGGGDGILKMYFGNKGAAMRIDPPNGQGYMIVEPDSGRMTVVVPAQQVYMTMPDGPSLGPIPAPGQGTYKKTGTDTIAGLPCTAYDTSGTGQDGQVCLTDDGVLLRGWSIQDGARQTMEAVTVTYAAQPAALFAPPPGFTKLDMPGIGGAMFPNLGK